MKTLRRTVIVVAAALASTLARGQTTERASVDSSGTQGNAHSGIPYFDMKGVSISADGRFVAFGSEASNLVATDTNGSFDVFVRDRQTGTTEFVERLERVVGGLESLRASS